MYSAMMALPFKKENPAHYTDVDLRCETSIDNLSHAAGLQVQLNVSQPRRTLIGHLILPDDTDIFSFVLQNNVDIVDYQRLGLISITACALHCNASGFNTNRFNSGHIL